MKISRNFQQFCKLRLTLIICREIYQQFINSSYWGNWGDVHGERKIIITSNIFDKFDKFDRICNLAKIRFDVVLYPEHSSWNDIFQQSLRHGMVRAQWNRREPDDANVKRSETSIRKSVTRRTRTPSRFVLIESGAAMQLNLQSNIVGVKRHDFNLLRLRGRMSQIHQTKWSGEKLET